MNFKKTLLQFILFLVIIAGIGFWLFRVIDWADKNKNESAAISTLINVSMVQKDLKGCFLLKDLVNKGLIDSKLNDGEKAGYLFTLSESKGKCEITATPKNSSKGNRSFYTTNQDNWKIHFSDDFNTKANINHPTADTRLNY